MSFLPETLSVKTSVIALPGQNTARMVPASVLPLGSIVSTDTNSNATTSGKEKTSKEYIQQFQKEFDLRVVEMPHTWLKSSKNQFKKLKLKMLRSIYIQLMKLIKLPLQKSIQKRIMVQVVFAILEWVLIVKINLVKLVQRLK